MAQRLRRVTKARYRVSTRSYIHRIRYLTLLIMVASLQGFKPYLEDFDSFIQISTGLEDSSIK